LSASEKNFSSIHSIGSITSSAAFR